MNGNRRFVTLFVLLGTLLLTFAFASSAFASPVASKKAQLRQVQAKLQTVYHQVDVAVEKYNQATSQLNTVTSQIKENERLLKVAEYNLGVANKQLSARAEDMYRARDVGMVDVLFAANSFDDLVTQLDVMERLGNSDVDTVKSIAAYQQDIKDRRVKLGSRQEGGRQAGRRGGGAQGRGREPAGQARADDRRPQVPDQPPAGAAGRRGQGRRGCRGSRSRMAAAPAAAPAAEAAAPSSTRAAPATRASSASPSATSACPTCTAAPARAASTAPASAMYCYAQIGIGLSHGATDQQHASTPVPLNALQPGDLVFFGNAGYSYHVGIYVGGGSMIHAPHTGANVQLRLHRRRLDRWPSLIFREPEGAFPPVRRERALRLEYVLTPNRGKRPRVTPAGVTPEDSTE